MVAKASVMIALSVASSAIGAYGALQQGKATAQAAEMERAQLEDQQRMIKIQALDEEAERRRELRKTLSTQRAQAGAMGFDASQSRSFFAITRDTEETAGRDIANIRLNALSGIRTNQLAQSQKSLEAKAAGRAAMLKATGSLISGASNAYQIDAKYGDKT